MKRAEAHNLIDDLADAGYSCTMNVVIFERHIPSENCGVSVHSPSFDHVDINKLVEIGESHGLGLHLIGDTLSFFAPSKVTK